MHVPAEAGLDALQVQDLGRTVEIRVVERCLMVRRQ